jgi:hypothetical protein
MATDHLKLGVQPILEMSSVSNVPHTAVEIQDNYGKINKNFHNLREFLNTHSPEGVEKNQGKSYAK